MRTILFYYPSNKRAISIESLIIKFRERGNNVFFLTQTPEAEIHQELKDNGIVTQAYVIEKKSALLYYFKHLLFLIRFCKTHKIDLVYSHLQQASIIAVFAQFFVKAKFYICRHHADRSGLAYNFNQTLFDKIINRLAKLMIVPSQKVYDQVTIAEHVSPKKVKLINYGYDFSKYTKPDALHVKEIREQYNAPLLLVKIARLVPGKRYDILFDVLNDLIKKEKLNIKLIAISDGPLMDKFSAYIKKEGLQENIFLIGDQTSIMDYLEAADAVVLLSDSEASNNVIKEAGILKKCVLICENVGDFNDYIKQDYSGLFLDKEQPQEDLKKYLKDLYYKKVDTEKMGAHLCLSVYSIFSIENVMNSYTEFHQ